MAYQPPELPGLNVEVFHKEVGALTKFVRSLGRTSPMIRFGAKFSAMADKVYMTTDHCILYLSRRMGTARAARNRARTRLGRVFNKMSGENPDFIVLSGAVLAGTLEFLGKAVPDAFDRGRDYKIDFAPAEQLHTQLLEKARLEGLLK